MTQSSNGEDVTTGGAVDLSALDMQGVISKFQRNSQDTGSPEVQVALLTKRLVTLTKHFGSNPKDYHSRRGMMNIISQRKRMLQYLKGEDVLRYRNTIAALGLRK
jgi:small subunit ribosomal protein S15